MKRSPPPPSALLTERALLAEYPQLTLQAVKRSMLSGAFPQRVPLPAGGYGWRADEVQQAMQARDTPTARLSMPRGHVGIEALVGVPAVSRSMANANKKSGDGPHRPRQARVGLVPFDAAGLARAVAAGQFPAPVKGPWGEAWSLEDVQRWRRNSR